MWISWDSVTCEPVINVLSLLQMHSIVIGDGSHSPHILEFLGFMEEMMKVIRYTHMPDMINCVMLLGK